MANNEADVVTEEKDNEVEESLDLPETKEGEEDATDWKAEALKLREKAIAQRERTKALKKKLAETSKAVEVVASSKQASVPKTNELDETQLDYLDLKGVTADEDIAIIQKVVQRTGLTVRQALKDEYVQEKLKANQAQRELKSATPSATKRGGSQSDGFEAAFAQYEKTGKLPSDYELRRRIVNTRLKAETENKPAWH